MRRALSLFLMILIAISSLPAFAEDLTEGARGEDVERFQQRLADLGYLSGGVDGIYGKQTTEAVSLFQTFNGMTVTGEADEGTQAAVFSAQAVELPETLERDDEGEDVQRLLCRRLAHRVFLRHAALRYELPRRYLALYYPAAQVGVYLFGEAYAHVPSSPLSFISGARFDDNTVPHFPQAQSAKVPSNAKPAIQTRPILL